MNGPVTAISLDRDRLCAVHGVASADRVRVKSWFCAPAPADVNTREAAAMGAWLASEMDKAEMGRAKLIFAVPRGEVVLKQLKLPKGEGESELAGMVRLQMSRQLTMAVEGTAIDYVPIGSEEGDSVGVLASALPGERMTWCHDVAKAAGCKLERVSLRAAGLAALLAGVSQRHTGPVLGVAAGWGSVEFVVVEDGRLVFARSADVGLATGEESSFVPRVAVEAKRTWMSYRGAEGSAEVDAVVMPGRGRLGQELGRACAEAMELPFEPVEMPAVVELPTIPEADGLVLSPLIGLLAEHLLSRETLDFAHPRKAPDLGAARRQKVLAGLLAVIVLGGGGAIYLRNDLDGRRGALKALQAEGAALRLRQGEFLAHSARLSHVQQWTSARVDWLAHLKYLSEQMPDPRQALLDQVNGNLAANVSFAPKDGKYDAKGWRVAQRAAFSLQGHAKQREVADGLRDRLVAAKAVYPDVQSKGPDTPDAFALVLSTNLASPESAPEPKNEKGGSK